MIERIFSKFTDIEAVLQDIQKIAKVLWNRGWSEKNAGNISIKLIDSIQNENLQNLSEYKFEIPFPALKNQCFYITASGKRMQDIGESAVANGLFIQVNDSGNKYHILKIGNEDIRPSSEFRSHMAIHNMIAERGSHETVVMHTHATEMIALTHYPKIKCTKDLNRLLWGIHPEAIESIPKGIGLVKYNLSGTTEIANLTVEKFMDHDLVAWEKHGIIGIGKNPVETFDSIDIACKLAKIWFLCKSAGFEPEGLTENQILAKKLNS